MGAGSCFGAFLVRGAARTAAEQEVERLQRLVREAVRLLEAAGDDRGARRIERGLRGT